MLAPSSPARLFVLSIAVITILLTTKSVSSQTPNPTPPPGGAGTTTAGAGTTTAGAGTTTAGAGTTTAGAGTTTAGATTTTASAAAVAAATPVPIKVTKVTGHLALFNTITVEVEKLSDYLQQTGKDPKKFILYLDWRPLRGVTSRLADGDKLLFDINRTADSTKEWDDLLGRPFAGTKGFTYPVAVSMGYENENPVPTAVDGDQKYSLIVINKIGFWVFVVAFALAVFGFLWLARNTGIIRDPCLELTATQRPYSLGRAQMAFWFFVVATSYALIWLITSNRDSLTQTALGLIGISTATALGAAVVGASKSSGDEANGKALLQEQGTLELRLKQIDEERVANPQNLEALNREAAEKTTRLEQVSKELHVLRKRSQPVKTEGFFDDILSDAEGYSLHRFQMAIWTVVLGIVFVADVFNRLAMPELSGTLLALMGISGGTYIGFKFPEKQGATDPPGDQNK